MNGLDSSLIHLAAILWSGMLIISGSVWVLGSQVGRVAEAIERQGAGAPAGAAGRPWASGRAYAGRPGGRREASRRRPGHAARR